MIEKKYSVILNQRSDGLYLTGKVKFRVENDKDRTSQSLTGTSSICLVSISFFCQLRNKFPAMAKEIMQEVKDNLKNFAK